MNVRARPATPAFLALAAPREASAWSAAVQTVGIVSPGAMGSAVGAAYRAAGNRVVTTVDGRSRRTAALAEQAGLELLPDLDAVVGESELVLSIVPPARGKPDRCGDRRSRRPNRRAPARRGLERGLAGNRARARAGARRVRVSSWSTARSRAARRAPTTARASTSPVGLRQRSPRRRRPGSMPGRSERRSVLHRP